MSTYGQIAEPGKTYRVWQDGNVGYVRCMTDEERQLREDRPYGNRYAWVIPGQPISSLITEPVPGKAVPVFSSISDCEAEEVSWLPICGESFISDNDPYVRTLLSETEWNYVRGDTIPPSACPLHMFHNIRPVNGEQIMETDLETKVRETVANWPNACDEGRQEFLNRFKKEYQYTPEKGQLLIFEVGEGQDEVLGQYTGESWHWVPLAPLIPGTNPYGMKPVAEVDGVPTWLDGDKGSKQFLDWVDGQLVVSDEPAEKNGQDGLRWEGESDDEFADRVRELITEHHPKCARAFLEKVGLQEPFKDGDIVRYYSGDGKDVDGCLAIIANSRFVFLEGSDKGKSYPFNDHPNAKDLTLELRAEEIAENPGEATLETVQESFNTIFSEEGNV